MSKTINSTSYKGEPWKHVVLVWYKSTNMPATFDTVIPKGSWVLVTGVNGYVASHTADQLLQHGYKVRGTVRNTTKNQWIKDLFDRKYGAGCFELVQVEDMTSPGAFDHAVKGKFSQLDTYSC